MKKKPKFEYLEVVVFDPEYEKKHSGTFEGHPLNGGELVLWLGEMPNQPGHAAVVKWDGKTVWGIHTDECRKANDEEL